MTMLIAGLLLFLGGHLLRVVAPDFRAGMIARLGPWGWKAAYSLPALAGFVLLVLGYDAARWTSPVLWDSPPWTRMVATLVMAPVLVVFVSAYLPGKIRESLRHPMLLATIAWAAVHLLANGRVADLVLFGSFLAWALVVTLAAWRRPQPAPAGPNAALFDLVAVLVGVAAWMLLIRGGHVWLVGMPVS
jgi:uncharacterized membrane protein